MTKGRAEAVDREHPTARREPPAALGMAYQHYFRRVVQRPVYGSAVVFSLSVCALAQGPLRATQRKYSWKETLKEGTRLAQQKWFGDAETAIRDIGDTSVAVPAGSLIGWTVPWEKIVESEFYRLCVDPALTIQVLSRRVGDLYIATRPPRYDRSHLLQPTAFAVDDPRFEGVDLSILGIKTTEKGRR